MIHEYVDEIIPSIKNIRLQQEKLDLVINQCVTTLSEGKKILFCGNGGSAAEAQHLSAEFMGKFMIDRKPLPALALTVDTSVLTAIGNDFSFNEVFARQVSGIGRPGDILFCLTTSGKSMNLLKAIKVARSIGIFCVVLTGDYNEDLDTICDINISVSNTYTPHIQEIHLILGHYICAQTEKVLFS